MFDDKNWKVKDVKYIQNIYRMYNYDNNNVDNMFVFYLETALRIHRLIEEFNFDLYYLKTTHRNNLKLKFSGIALNTRDLDVLEIKSNQSYDFYYLYKNMFFEVFYSIPHVNSNNNYSYDFLVLVKNGFDIKKISNHNFKQVLIKSCKKIEKYEINFSFIESIFKNRAILNNTLLNSNEYEYKRGEVNLSEKDFIKYYNNNNPDYDFDSYRNANMLKNFKEFNQDLYVLSKFKCLTSHCWNFGRKHYIELNRAGKTCLHKDMYDSNFFFFCYSSSPLNSVAVNSKGEIIDRSELDELACCFFDIDHDMDFLGHDLNIDYCIYGIVDLDKKEVKIVDEPFSSIPFIT